jgi:hypothetical protein
MGRRTRKGGNRKRKHRKGGNVIGGLLGAIKKALPSYLLYQAVKMQQKKKHSGGRKSRRGGRKSRRGGRKSRRGGTRRRR